MVDYRADFKAVKKDGVLFYKSEGISFPHGFSTRLGGISSEVQLASMNLGYERGEAASTVDENYRRFLSAVTDGSCGVEAFDILERRVIATQIHSNTVRIADCAGRYPDCDGFFTERAGIILTVRTADCTPIIFVDEKRRYASAVHAGWRGTISGIAEAALEIFFKKGSLAEDIRVAIGPSICRECYKVGEDFYLAVKEARGAEFAERHIQKRRRENEELFFADVVGMNCELIEALGVPRANISLSQKCTACEGELFYSHRAQGNHRGSLAAAVMIE